AHSSNLAKMFIRRTSAPITPSRCWRLVVFRPLKFFFCHFVVYHCTYKTSCSYCIGYGTHWTCIVTTSINSWIRYFLKHIYFDVALFCQFATQHFGNFTMLFKRNGRISSSKIFFCSVSKNQGCHTSVLVLDCFHCFF